MDLRATFLSLAQVLERAGVAYAFIGAVPVLAWGRVRATTDLDIVVLAESGWSRLVAEMESAGFEIQRSVASDPADPLPDIVFFQSPSAATVRVDVFLAKTEFERVVIETCRVTRVLEREIPIARPEASIIYKLIASRPKDLDDVEGIFAARRAAGDTLDWDFLDHWAAEWGIAEKLSPFADRFRTRETE